MGTFSKFPTPVEFNAASALVRLQFHSPVLSSSSNFSTEISSNGIVVSQHSSSSSSDEEDEEVSSSASDSTSSVLTCNSAIYNHDPMLLLAFAAHCCADQLERGSLHSVLLMAQETTVEISRETSKRILHNNTPWRRHRSILCRRPKYQMLSEMPMEESNGILHIYVDNDQDAASLSVNTSIITSSMTGSSSSSRYPLRRLPCRDVDVSGMSKKKRKEERSNDGERPQKRVDHFSSGVWRKAEAIKEFLRGKGCASEVVIREVLGNSPDTSKALRLLLKRKEVMRTGGGGRSDPFRYKVSSPLGEVDYVGQQ